jgi:hypothetical protein
MNTNKKTTELENMKISVKMKLSALWAAGMLSSLNGDTYRLNDPVVLKSSLENTGSVVTTPELLLVASLIFVGSIFMCVLTLTLQSSVSRWANRIMGIFYAIFPLVFLFLHLVVWRSAGYEMVWATAQIVFSLLIVWYAWKWPKQENAIDKKSNQ